MHMQSHGIQIDLIRIGDRVFVEFTLRGKLTHEDYKTFVPFVESAIGGLPPKSLYILVDMRKFEGWTPRAAWDDFRFGLEIRKDVAKMAIVGDRKWEELAAKMTDWMIAGDAKFFNSIEEARRWLRTD